MPVDVGVDHSEFALAAESWPDLRPVMYGSPRPPSRWRRVLLSLGVGRKRWAAQAIRITAVEVTVNGIRGGGSAVEVPYRVVSDVTQIRAALPPVWVAQPADRRIRHVNIWKAHKSRCPVNGEELPSFCWGSFEAGWRDAGPELRNLGNLLEYIRQFLGAENHDSPAR